MRTAKAILITVCGLVLLGATACTEEPTADPDPDNPVPENEGAAAWPMHPIDDRFRGANALGAGDVNGDGLQDYVTNYEFDQRYVIQLHPGAGTDPRGEWERIQPFPVEDLPTQGINAESAALGDVDGDGNVDLLAAQGYSDAETFEGSDPGLRVVFGPPVDQIADRNAWVDGGTIPATLDQGHFQWVGQPQDLNGDGLLDMVAGGRVHGSNRITGGIVWLEAPADPAARRDMTQWRMHRIDAITPSGHGFAWSDVDGDGDLDIIDANADFNTPSDEELVVWYRNPGPTSPALRQPWERTVIYQGDEFDVKPSITVADLDQDGNDDFLTQVEDKIYWFRKTSTEPVRFERVTINKPEQATQFSRPIRVGDMNGDGKLDLVGFLVHERATLPSDKYGGFLATYSGDRPGADNWTFTPIRWGSGTTMRFTGFGEKWDQVWLDDVDGDGDLDIVANNEEWWINPESEVAAFNRPIALETHSVATVWFENRLDEAPYRFNEANDTVRIETEQAARVDDSYWVIRNRYPGYSGTGYVQAFHSLDVGEQGSDATLGTSYLIDVTGGEYRVWVRRYTPSQWGWGLGGEKSDSLWIGVNGESFRAVGDGGLTDEWEWVEASSALPIDDGLQLLTLRVRDRGVAVDEIVLTKDPSFDPN